MKRKWHKRSPLGWLNHSANLNDDAMFWVKLEDVEADLLCKLGDFSSNRLRIITPVQLRIRPPDLWRAEVASDVTLGRIEANIELN